MIVKKSLQCQFRTLTRKSNRGGARPGEHWSGHASRGPYPIAMDAIGHTMSELHQRHRTAGHIGGVEHRKIAAVFAAAPDHRQQPAVSLAGVVAAGDERRF